MRFLWFLVGITCFGELIVQSASRQYYAPNDDPEEYEADEEVEYTPEDEARMTDAERCRTKLSASTCNNVNWICQWNSGSKKCVLRPVVPVAVVSARAFAWGVQQ